MQIKNIILINEILDIQDCLFENSNIEEINKLGINVISFHDLHKKKNKIKNVLCHMNRNETVVQIYTCNIKLLFKLLRLIKKLKFKVIVTVSKKNINNFIKHKKMNDIIKNVLVEQGIEDLKIQEVFGYNVKIYRKKDDFIKIYNDVLKIKCLHVLAGLVSGGVEAMLYNYLNNDEWNDFIIDFITHGSSIEKCQKQFEDIGINIFNVVSKKENFFQNIKQLDEIMKNNNYDIVHAHMSWYNFIPLLIAKKNKIQIRISHSHLYLENLSIKKRLLYKILSILNILVANVYFSCSKRAGEFLFLKRKFLIINNGINTEKYKFDLKKRTYYRDKLGLKDTFCIGHIGRFSEQKNHDYILKIFKKYIEKDNAKLLLIGDGELKKEIENKAIEMKIQDKIVFLGAIENVHEIINAIDIFVFPSKYEGLGIVLIEAQCNGIYSLASTKVPEETKISDNIEYLNIEECDILNWVEAIYTNKNKKINRETQYKNIERANYDINDNVKQLVEYYKKIYSKEI